MMNDHTMIAFLPEDGSWCKQDLPHMTLVYSGAIDTHSPSDFNALAKDAVAVASLMGQFYLAVTGVEEFGDEDKVDVLTFHPTPQLLVARKMVEKWNASKHKDYKPHATIGPAGSASDSFPSPDHIYSDKNRPYLPLRLWFNKIGAFWGDQSLIFNLGEL